LHVKLAPRIPPLFRAIHRRKVELARVSFVFGDSLAYQI